MDVSGSFEPDRAQELEQPDPEADPDQEPEHRRDRAHHERLEHDGPHHLSARRAHGAQQAQLARALGHEDGEGVEDHERADHHADGGEPEQRVGEEAEELAHRLADLLDRLGW